MFSKLHSVSPFGWLKPWVFKVCSYQSAENSQIYLCAFIGNRGRNGRDYFFICFHGLHYSSTKAWFLCEVHHNEVQMANIQGIWNAFLPSLGLNTNRVEIVAFSFPTSFHHPSFPRLHVILMLKLFQSWQLLQLLLVNPLFSSKGQKLDKLSPPFQT